MQLLDVSRLAVPSENSIEVVVVNSLFNCFADLWIASKQLLFKSVKVPEQEGKGSLEAFSPVELLHDVDDYVKGVDLIVPQVHVLVVVRDYLPSEFEHPADDEGKRLRVAHPPVIVGVGVANVLQCLLVHCQRRFGLGTVQSLLVVATLALALFVALICSVQVLSHVTKDFGHLLVSIELIKVARLHNHGKTLLSVLNQILTIRVFDVLPKLVVPVLTFLHLFIVFHCALLSLSKDIGSPTHLRLMESRYVTCGLVHSHLIKASNGLLRMFSQLLCLLIPVALLYQTYPPQSLLLVLIEHLLLQITYTAYDLPDLSTQIHLLFQ